MLRAEGPVMAEVRDADLPREIGAVERLWLAYLTWCNDGLESRYGFRLPVREAIARDLATVAKFQPPYGRLLLAFEGDLAIGTACLQRIGPDTVISEIKRMYVQPSHRRAGVGRALLGQLIAGAQAAGYARVRLDSPDFMAAAHDLQRSSGFVQIGPYRSSPSSLGVPPA
jgi:GNAT superfamily N-acetyltransferase